jgi:hypothetical protein
MNSELHSWMTLALIIVSVSLVAGITYVYTNRNRRITILLTLISIFFVSLLKIISIVDVELGTHFLGEYQSHDSQTITAGPGWGLLLHAWHIWIVPVCTVCFVFFIIIYILMTHKKSSPTSTLDVRSPIIADTNTGNNKTEQTRSERLNALMMIDAAKKQSRVANQKLTESLLANASYEIRINELTTQITTLEESLQIVQTSSAEQIEALQSELTQKNTECESLNAKLESANQDIERAKVLLKKVAELNKKKPSEE